MPSADEKPVPGSQSRPAHPAKSSSACQDSHYRASERPYDTVLILAPKNDFTAALITTIGKVMNCAIHAESVEEAILHIASHLKIIIVHVGRNHSDALQAVQIMKEEALGRRIPWPVVVAFSHFAQAPNVPLAFERLGTHYLFRPTHEQIVNLIQKVQWEHRTKKYLPTLIIQRREGHVSSVVIQAGVAEREIRLGPRLRQLVEYLALHVRREHTTEMIADVLGVCRPVVKVYLGRLREAFNKATAELQLHARGEDVFWTRKLPGGYVHGLAANVHFRDE